MSDVTDSKQHIIIIIVTISSLCVLIYTFKFNNTNASEMDKTSVDRSSDVDTNNESASRQINRVAKRKLKPTNACDYNTYLSTSLGTIIAEYTYDRSHCMPNEQRLRGDVCPRHDSKYPKHTRWKDDDRYTRGVGVVWCVVGLLIISVIAAFVDACMAKVAEIKKSRSMLDVAGKPSAIPLRRCSLASMAGSRNSKRQMFGSRRPASIAEGPPLRASFVSTPLSTQQTPPTGTSVASVRVKFD